MTILSHGIQPNYQFKKSPILHSGILIVFAKVFSYCTTSVNKIQFIQNLKDASVFGKTDLNHFEID